MRIKSMGIDLRLTGVALGLAAAALSACSGDDSTAVTSAADGGPDAAKESGAMDSGADATISDGGAGDTSTASDSATASDSSAAGDSSPASDAAPVDLDAGIGTGPGASLTCGDAGAMNAWQKYGTAAFAKVNESIFTNVLADLADAGTKDLGTAFTKVADKSLPATQDDSATFKGTLAAFLVYAYGGPSSIMYTDGKIYNGSKENMAADHAGFGITSAQYSYFVTNIVVPALASNGVSSADISTCFAPVLTDPGFEATIVGDAKGTGPGAGFKCASTVDGGASTDGGDAGAGTNAFDTYGTAAFVKVNEAIFTNVLAELGDAGSTNLGGSFSKVGTGAPGTATADGFPAFKGNLAAFLVYAYGGPAVITYTDGVMYYGVQDMTQAHAGLGITQGQYNYFLTNIVVPALTSSGVPMTDVSSCFAPVLTSSSFEASIIGH